MNFSLFLVELFGGVFRHLEKDDSETVELFLTLISKEASDG